MTVRPALSPCMIGTCKINNRFVMTAANLGYCRDGYVTDQVIEFYRERARGKTGLIIAGAAGVDPAGKNTAGMMQICDDSCIPSMKRLTEAVHEAGSRIFLQLMHAGAYARQSEHQGRKAVAPSGYVCRFTKEETHELTEQEISGIVSCFRAGAVRAVKAGFDGIELMGSAGYLISEFLSPATNRRMDRYGGGLAERTQFLLEIIGEVRKGVGRDYPVIVRLSGSDFVPGGNGLKDFLEIGSIIENQVDGIDVTGGWHESAVPQITYNVPRGAYLYMARAMKEKVSVPVIGCNRLDLHRAAEAIRNRDCDMAGMLRGLIADPFLVKKYMEQDESSIRPCLACNQQCLDRIFTGGKLECAVNFLAGREHLPFRPRDEGKEILVIGAGVSGLVYGALAAENNRVTIWERETDYGGAGRAVGALPYREDVLTYIRYLFRRCVSNGVTFSWGTAGTMENIRKVMAQGRFDRVILAAGGTMVLSGDGTGYKTEPGANVLTPVECILGTGSLGRNIAVIGSGYKAVQAAQYCAAARKTGDREQTFLRRYAPEDLEQVNGLMKWEPPNITLLSPGKNAGGGFGASTRWTMLNDIKQKGVKVVSGVKILCIGTDRVTYLEEGKEKSVRADTVIVSEGWQSNTEFACLKDETGDRLTVIGDARRPGRITDAVKDAFTAAMNLEEGNYV